MLEIVILIILIVGMYRFAEMEKFSGILWGAITLALGLLSLLIPLPFLRILLAGIASFAAMYTVKLLAKR